MLTATTIVDEILDLKKQRRATLLAHHYQQPEIQELADVIGDSLELARKARDFEGDAIAFCGVWFMAETAKVLNPDRIVVVPDREASCSLVDACPVEPVREFRRQNPDYTIVSYINTSIEVKAESDILCTSRNAVKVVNSIPREKPILFLPDRNLGNYVQAADGPRRTCASGRAPASCTPRFRRGAWPRRGWSIPTPKWWRTRNARKRCWPWPILWAPLPPSSSTVAESRAEEFIVLTESGIHYSLHKQLPRKRFHFVANENCNCSECPYMKLNTLEKLRDCLLHLEPRVELPAETMERALAPLERMLALK